MSDARQQLNEMKNFLDIIRESDDDTNNCGVCGDDFEWVGNPEDSMCPRCTKEYEGGEFDESVETCEQCGREGCKCKPGECECEPVTEAVTGGMVEIGGQEYPWRRVPIEVYGQFKAQYPGAVVRFRGPRHGRDNTRKSNATHFYVVTTMNKAQLADFNAIPEDSDPDGMGHYEVVVRRGVGTDDFYEDVVSGPVPFPEANKIALGHVKMIKSESEQGARVKKSHMLDQVGWSIRPNSYSLDDKYKGGFVFIRPAEDADVEAWYGEGIELGSVVEAVLQEYPGQPKDYYDPEDKVEDEAESSSIDDDYGDAEDEELGLRFD